MPDLSSQTNQQIENLSNNVLKTNEMDISKLLNTEDITPVQQTLLDSDKSIDKLNGKVTKSSTFILGDRDKPIIAKKQKKKPEDAKKQEQKQKAIKELKSKTSKSAKASQQTSSIKSAKSKTNTKNKHSLTNKLKDSINKKKYLSSDGTTSIDKPDLAKLIQLKALDTNSPMLTDKMNSGLQSGDLFDKVDTSPILTEKPVSLEDTISNPNSSPLFKQMDNTRKQVLNNSINMPFNNGCLNSDSLFHKLRSGGASAATSLKDIAFSVATYIGRRVGKEAKCIYDLLISGGGSSGNSFMDMNFRLNLIKIFCDKNILNHLSINKNISQLASTETDLNKLNSYVSDVNPILPSNANSTLTELDKSSKTFEKLAFLENLTKFTVVRNDPTLLNNVLANDDMSGMLHNANSKNITNTTSIASDYGNYNSLETLIDTYEKHRVPSYRSSIVNAHSVNSIDDETNRTQQFDKYGIDMSKILSPEFDAETFHTSNKSEESNPFEGLNMISIDKAKQMYTSNKGLVKASLAPDQISLLARVPLI